MRKYCKMKRIAHRGYTDSATIQDNSKESVVFAIENNFSMVEVDVLFHEDRLILHHDVYNIRKNAITIEEFFNIENLDTISIYLDLKGNVQTTYALIDFFHKNSFLLHKHDIYIGSFNLNQLELLKEMKLKLGIITCNTFSYKEIIEIVEKYKLHFISCSIESVSEELIKIASFLEIKIFVFTCKNNLDLEYVSKFSKIDGIVTDFKYF